MTHTFNSGRPQSCFRKCRKINLINPTLGSPSSRHIGPGIEAHIPTLFLHLSPDDLAHSVPGAGAGLLGWDSLLSREDPESFISLPLLQVRILSSDWLTHIVLSSDWLTQIILSSDWLTQIILSSDWSRCSARRV